MESRLLTETELKLLKESTAIRIRYEGVSKGDAKVVFVKKISASGRWNEAEQTSEATLPISVTDYHRYKENYVKPDRYSISAKCEDHEVELLQAFIKKSDRVSISAWMNNSCIRFEELGLASDELFFCITRGGNSLLVPLESSVCDPEIRLIKPVYC